MRYIVQLQIRILAYFIYMGLQAEFGIEDYTQVTDLFGGHDFLPIEIDANWGTGQGLTFRDTSNVSVLSAWSFGKFDVIQEWIIARYEIQVLSSK